MSNKPLYCIAEYEDYALSTLPKPTADYFRSGSENEFTIRLNREAFHRLRIRPRVLVDTSALSSTVTVFGDQLSMPIGISPTPMQKVANPSGECATARAAGEMGTVFTLATLSTCRIEEVAAAAPDTAKWFQLYMNIDGDVTRQLVERAENSGYKAIVLTVDTPVVGIRYAELKTGFKLPPHLKFVNFVDEKSTKVSQQSECTSRVGLKKNSLLKPLTWEDVKWLKSITKLPIVLKGILTAEDAVLAADVGVAAVLVSNHGGRQLDTTPASIEALPEIVRAVNGRCEVFLDSGVRNGTDVLKAVALGATNTCHRYVFTYK